MKVLFVTSEHPSRIFGGLGTFTREYTRVLRKKCQVKVVYFHFGPDTPPSVDSDIDYVCSANRNFEAYNIEARILETAAFFRSQVQPIITDFDPDVIHCNDRQTFLPFRFDTNVIYSSHLLFCDLLGLQGITDEYLQELKIERCAFSSAAISVVYSRFAVDRVISQISPKCSPVVLPLAIKTDNFYDNKDSKNIGIAYFGRFEENQKGFLQFIKAVQLIGKELKEKYSIRFSLFGKGSIPPNIDISLFDNVTFLEGDALQDEYAKTNIVVMPSRYEPFGLTGLEAMASGCLLLVTKGLGMDEYAKPTINCLSIPNDGKGIAIVLKNAVIHLSDYEDLRIQGKKDSRNWTWERCVEAHYLLYSAIKTKKHNSVQTAYKSESYRIQDRYKEKVSDAYIQEELTAISSLSKTPALQNTAPSLVITTVSTLPDETPKPTHLISTQKFIDGSTYRLEFLPFVDNSFNTTYVVGSWEMVINPIVALSELFRITEKKLVLCYRIAERLPWQTIKMENKASWEQCGSDNLEWEIESSRPLTKDYAFVVWEKKILNLEIINCQEEKNEKEKCVSTSSISNDF